MSTTWSSDEDDVKTPGKSSSFEDVPEEQSIDRRSTLIDENASRTNFALAVKGYDVERITRVGMNDWEVKVDQMGKITSNVAFNDLSAESYIDSDDPMFSMSNVRVAPHGRFISLSYNGMKKGYATIEGRFIYTAPKLKDFFSLFTTRVVDNICIVSGHDTKRHMPVGRAKLKDGMTVEFWATDSVGNPMVSGHLDVYRDKGKYYIHANSSETLIGSPLFCTRSNKLVGVVYSQTFVRPYVCEVSPVMVPGIDTHTSCRTM